MPSITNVTVTLFNIIGQVIATKVVSATAVGNVEFNVSGLNAGVYLYQVKTGTGQIACGRVVVEHSLQVLISFPLRPFW